jgi:hypothetical protein
VNLVRRYPTTTGFLILAALVAVAMVAAGVPWTLR